MTRFLSLALIAPLATLAACPAADDDSSVGEAQQASTVVETTTETSYVTDLVIADPSSLAAVHTDAAGATIAASVQAKLAAGLTVPACASVTSDNKTFVEVTFTGCTGARGLHGLSGTVRASMTFESAPCGNFQCVSGVVYALETSGLTLNGTTFAGAWQLHDPLAPGEPYTWNGSLSVDGTRQSVESMSSATIAVTDACVTYDLDATITSSARTLTVNAAGVSRCLDACPTAGTVTIAGSLRGSLTWSYHGDGKATVTTGAGAAFDVTLACAR